MKQGDVFRWANVLITGGTEHFTALVQQYHQRKHPLFVVTLCQFVVLILLLLGQCIRLLLGKISPKQNKMRL